MGYSYDQSYFPPIPVLEIALRLLDGPAQITDVLTRRPHRLD